ncbi:MAG: IS200/IS605 family transposase [Candidatus Njordarchaeia archaeon]
MFGYRSIGRGILVGPVTATLRELIESKASEMGWGILALEIMPEHIHLFIQADAKTSPSSIVRLLKGFTSRRLGERFPYLRKIWVDLGERLLDINRWQCVPGRL